MVGCVIGWIDDLVLKQTDWSFVRLFGHRVQQRLFAIRSLGGLALLVGRFIRSLTVLVFGGQTAKYHKTNLDIM